MERTHYATRTKEVEKNIAKQEAKADRERLRLQKEMEELSKREELAKIKALEAEEMLIEKELRIKEMENELERRIQKDSALIIDMQPAANVVSINDCIKLRIVTEMPLCPLMLRIS